MDTPFPFGFPGRTAFYLGLYVLTFVLHQAFMHYVLAGSLYVAWTTIWPGRKGVPRTDQPLAATLRDWMPFMLSAAITAGVAPLLSIQIVYQRQFYTANLLLWWRWMVVVPVLIAAFYLLYLLKSSILSRWPLWVRCAVAVGTAGCFVFVGFCWTANHLLSISEATWPDVYATGRLPLIASTVIFRMLIWIGCSFASMSVVVGWQLLFQQKHQEPSVVVVGARTLAVLSLGGLVVATAAGAAYVFEFDVTTRELLLCNAALPYVLLAPLGILVQVAGWIIQLRCQRLRGSLLAVASAGACLSLFGVSVAREVFRIAAIDFASLYQRHIAAARIGGFGVFLVSAVLVSLLIAWCLWLVRHGLIRRELS